MSRTEELEELKLYTLNEIAPVLGVTKRTLLNHVYNGTLKANKIGGKWRVTKSQLDDFLKGGK